MPLQLRDTLHWCESGGRVVFLDVEADRYFCLSAPASEAFLRLAAGRAQPKDTEDLQALIARGMLVETLVEGGIKVPPSIEDPTGDFLGGPFGDLRALSMLRTISSELCWAWALRTRPFHQVLEDVQRYRGSGDGPPTRRCRMIDEIVLGAAAAALVTGSHDRCLVRALAAYARCRKTGIAAKLVFGVISHPFAAHCWIQLGSLVLVGGYEQARLYTPILVLE